MTKTGPQRYPGASTAYWYQPKYGGSAMESNVGVLHTTEGTTVPSYGGGMSAPNFTALPDIKNRRLRWYQHFDFDVSSRALVNLRDGVETNTLNAVQIELVGTCDPKHRTSWGSRRAGVDYLFWPDAPDWALAELGEFVRWAHDNHGIKLQSTVTWKPYPASYGANGVRLSGARWQDYYGWLGHQHVPENDHGDPGDIDFARVLQHAGPADAPTPPPAPPAVPPFPGRDAFRLGRTHPAVTQLDRQLVRLGHTRHHDGDGYQPGPRFTEYTRANVADFQRSREELRGDPDGFPGPLTWRLLHTL